MYKSYFSKFIVWLLLLLLISNLTLSASGTSKKLSLEDLNSLNLIKTPFLQSEYISSKSSNNLDFRYADEDNVPLIGIKDENNDYKYFYYWCTNKFILIYYGPNDIEEFQYSLTADKTELKIYYENGSFIELKEKDSKVDSITSDTIATILGVIGLVFGIHSLQTLSK